MPLRTACDVCTSTSIVSSISHESCREEAGAARRCDEQAKIVLLPGLHAGIFAVKTRTAGDWISMIPQIQIFCGLVSRLQQRKACALLQRVKAVGRKISQQQAICGFYAPKICMLFPVACAGRAQKVVW